MDHGGAPGEARRRDHAAELRDRRAGPDLRVHLQLRHVVGAAPVGGAERDLPGGGPVGGAGPEHLHHALHLLRGAAGVHRPALRHEARRVPVLRRLAPGHDGLRGGVPAGDEGRAAGGHAVGVGTALVLEEVRRGHQGTGRRSSPGEQSVAQGTPSLCLQDRTGHSVFRFSSGRFFRFEKNSVV